MQIESTERKLEIDDCLVDRIAIDDTLFTRLPMSSTEAILCTRGICKLRAYCPNISEQSYETSSTCLEDYLDRVLID